MFLLAKVSRRLAFAIIQSATLGSRPLKEDNAPSAPSPSAPRAFQSTTAPPGAASHVARPLLGLMSRKLLGKPVRSCPFGEGRHTPTHHQHPARPHPRITQFFHPTSTHLQLPRHSQTSKPPICYPLTITPLSVHVIQPPLQNKPPPTNSTARLRHRTAHYPVTITPRPPTSQRHPSTPSPFQLQTATLSTSYRRVRFYSERVCLVWNQTLSDVGVALEIFLK